MGVDTKLFVTAKKTAMLDLMPKLMIDINSWQRGLLDSEAKKHNLNRFTFLYNDNNRTKWSNGIKSVYTYDFNSFGLLFNINGENRDLFITHNCSNDYSDIHDGEKIIFSLGCWGMSTDIMKIVANSIQSFGDVYFIENDCSGDWEKLY